MATNAQHQASYRARQASAGSVRLDTHISADAHAALATMAERKGLSIRAAVETAIFTSSTTTSRKDACMTPTRPTQMTAGEAAELEQFKASLPNAIISAELDQRAQAMNGGAAGVAQKERVTAMLQANNQHFKK
jgi:hypothetical protein